MPEEVAVLREDVRRLLRRDLEGFKAVVMPDFFVDRIVKIDSPKILYSHLREKEKAGGGSVHRVEQFEMKGGNATNVAYALGRLGVSVGLITVADRHTKPVIEEAFSQLPNVKLSLVDGKPGYTVAFEFPGKNRRVNVMLSDIGDIWIFGPDKVPEDSWRDISEADFVCVMNWAANGRGTELAEGVFSHALENGVKTFFAPADLSSRAGEVPELFKRLEGLISVLSINENEARVMAKALSSQPLPLSYDTGDLKRSVNALAGLLDTTIDIHTPFGSASSSRGESCFAEAFEVAQNVSTGAGDVWDAADIMGYMIGLEPEERLLVANASAALYISSIPVEPPSKDQLSPFLEARIPRRSY